MRAESGGLKLGLMVVAVLLATAPGWSAPAISDVVHAGVLMEEGKQAFEQEQAGVAVKCLREAARLRPGWLAPQPWLALACQVTGDKDGALEAYRTVQRGSLATANFRRSNPPDQLDAVIDCEALTAWLINQSRWESGLGCLLPEPKLAHVARQHSLEMRDLGYFSHTSPVKGRETSLERFEAIFGFRPELIAENVARRWGSGYLLTPEKVTATHRGLLRKPEHRRNILLDEVGKLGVGIAVDESGAYWLTEVLVRYEDE